MPTKAIQARVTVAQICNLLYRRIAFGKDYPCSGRSKLAAPGGLQIRDTAECNSALRLTVRSLIDLTRRIVIGSIFLSSFLATGFAQTANGTPAGPAGFVD